MTQKEIKNCADYKKVREIVKHWYKDDSEFALGFDDYGGKTYYWSVGHVRTRLVRRKSWDDMFGKNKNE